MAAPSRQNLVDPLAKDLAALVDDVEDVHPGTAGIALHTRSGTVQAGDPGRWHAWSTVKVPISVAAANAGIDEAMDVEGLTESAITGSDNASAAQLWWLLGGGTTAVRHLEELLAPYGGVDAVPLAEDFSPTSIGLIAWPLAGQAEFSSHLPCLDGAEVAYEAMGEVAPGRSTASDRSRGAFQGRLER